MAALSSISSRRSKAKLKCVLSTLYHHAIRYEWLTFNPISRVRTSQQRLRDKDVLDSRRIPRVSATSLRARPGHGLAHWQHWSSAF